MENNIFDIRVRCTNKDLLNYIKSTLVYGSELIPGLEFVSFINNECTTKEKQQTVSKPETTKSSSSNTTTIRKQYNKPYDGGWIDIEDKEGMDSMFNSFSVFL